MPEASQITYGLKELTALMIKDQGIKTGHWMVLTKFTWAVSNVMSEGGGPAGPGALTIVTEVGIQKLDEPGPLSVDAAEVWKSGAAEPKASARRTK